MLAVQLLRGERGDLPRAIEWAEAAAERLSAAGYGWTADTTTRESTDHYAALSAEQRAAFDRFWLAWRPRVGQTGGKQRAARRWRDLDPSAQLAAVITAAAAADAARPREQGEKRKWAEGWLTERRWEDQEPGAIAAPQSPGASRARQLAQELAGLRASQAKGIDCSAAIARCESELKSLGGNNGRE